jgi:hypothetical protein
VPSAPALAHFRRRLADVERAFASGSVADRRDRKREGARSRVIAELDPAIQPTGSARATPRFWKARHDSSKGILLGLVRASGA